MENNEVRVAQNIDVTDKKNPGYVWGKQEVVGRAAILRPSLNQVSHHETSTRFDSLRLDSVSCGGWINAVVFGDGLEKRGEVVDSGGNGSGWG